HNYDRIYRVVNTYESNRHELEKYASTSMLAGEQIKATVPGVEDIVTIRRFFNKDLNYQGKILPLRGLWATDGFFNVFSFNLISGNAETALASPYSLVLTRSAAEKLFGSTDVVGKVVTIEEEPYTVSALMDDPPRNSHLQFEMLASMLTNEQKLPAEELAKLRKWTNMWSNYVYFTLDEQADLGDVQAGLDRISEQENKRQEAAQITMSLQPMREFVISDSMSNQAGYHIDRSFIWILVGLALVVIISACFNYTNLSIARALRRSREVGIRKVIGASRLQVFLQFMLEAVLISVFALLFAFILFLFIRPQFLSIEPRFLERLSLIPSLRIYLYFVGLAVSIGLFAGFFPAVFFSRVEPAKVIKDISKLKLFRHVTLRKALITFQYVLSICFIVAICLGYQQYKYSLNFDLGFNTENILNLELQGNDPELLKHELEQLPEVTGISASLMVPSVGDTYSAILKYTGGADSTSIYYNKVDEHYLALHEHELIAGENFHPLNAEEPEESKVIVNEKTLTYIGIESPGEAIGREILIDNKPVQIIGVVRDFHYGTVYDPIRNFAFRQDPAAMNILNLRIATSDVAVTMDRLRAIWKQIDPVHTFEARFYEESIQETYSEYTSMMKIIGFLAVLAISIASFGLLGMVVFTTETRLKEISIRKIFGATERSLVMLLSRGFMVLLLIAGLIAVPLTLYLFDQVVFAGIAFRAPTDIFQLMLGTGLVIGIALLAISSQTIRVARANPAEVLGEE
ncbi:MAG: ABC transporter permease, partial [Lewinella sp.]|nr:ABC transporter permease [Lewinella sp.]